MHVPVEYSAICWSQCSSATLIQDLVLCFPWHSIVYFPESIISYKLDLYLPPNKILLCMHHILITDYEGWAITPFFFGTVVSVSSSQSEEHIYTEVTEVKPKIGEWLETNSPRACRYLCDTVAFISVLQFRYICGAVACVSGSKASIMPYLFLLWNRDTEEHWGGTSYSQISMYRDSILDFVRIIKSLLPSFWKTWGKNNYVLLDIESSWS